MINQGLVIGRFQLVGNHHKDLFDQVVEYHFNEQKLDRLNIAVGVADDVTARDPFSGAECWKMIKPIAEEAANKMKIPLDYRLVDDIHDPPNYAKHIERIFGFRPNIEDQITLFSLTPYTRGSYEDREGYLIHQTEERVEQHSTELRKLCAAGVSLEGLVPDHIPKFLEGRNAKRRLEKLMYDNPIPAVDLVIEYEDGIVLIERKDNRGHALPGGHIDYGESAESAAIREAKEETGLDVTLTGLIGVYSNPKRDERGHRISTVFLAEGFGKLKADDDARNAETYQLDKIPKKLAFDHSEIIQKAKRVILARTGAYQ
jgi:ADP-ribose pyrophosphatase YjhB (NUDIX family)